VSKSVNVTMLINLKYFLATGTRFAPIYSPIIAQMADWRPFGTMNMMATSWKRIVFTARSVTEIMPASIPSTLKAQPSASIMTVEGREMARYSHQPFIVSRFGHYMALRVPGAKQA